ncbi:MAG: endonuclease/exonuclease/phosphatase family protein, partial [Caldilinea sp.]
NAGGPLYEFTQIDPFDAEDGGAIGRNPRLGIFYNPARVQFASQPGDAQTDNSVLCSNQQAMLTLNPGRIGATASQFLDARKPLAAQFTFDGHDLFVIAIHLDNREADSPRQGAVQPPVQHSAARRLEQAQSVQGFVQQILACEPEAAIVVAGAPNDDPFSPAVVALKGSNLTTLMDLLGADAAYSEVNEGISRVAGDMFVSAALGEKQPVFDVVHTFAEFVGAPVTVDPAVAKLSPTLTIAATLYLPVVLR